MFCQKAKLKKGKLDLFRFWRRFNPLQNSMGGKKKKSSYYYIGLAK
jgi:hypothetical protein